MPVVGGRAQKRVNERASNHNLDPSSLPTQDLTRQDEPLEAANWSMEDWEEFEALLETERLILGQHQQQQRSDVNLLQSPERPPRPFLEAPPPRTSIQRSLPRPHSNFGVAPNQLTSILFNMTFSDAEDDHQGGSRNTSNDQDRSLSRSRTESGVSNASTVSLASPMSSAGPPAASSNGPAAPATAHGTASAREGAAGVELETAAHTATVSDMTGVDKKKILEKLQQIQGYIQQTTAAMAALEQQGDNGVQSDIYARYVHLNKSLQNQEEEYLDILARSLVLNKAAAQVANGSQRPASSPAPQINGREETAQEEGSRVVGVVGPENVRTLQDRLAASQEESVAIVSQMRASIARREDLMTRYKAARERLANLKKQRQGLQDEKHRLLTSSTTSAPYEDPIPGAENWSLEEVTQALVDFQALHDKVEHLTSVYTSKAQAADADDEEAQSDMTNKLGQLATKRRQLTDALTRLRGYQRQKQQQERDAGKSVETSQGSSTTPAETSDANQASASGNHSASNDRMAASPAPHVNGNVSALSPASVMAAASSVSQVSDELLSRQTQLESMQQQLSDMKKLLDVAKTFDQEVDREPQTLPAASASTEADGAVGGEFLEVSGRKIMLTEAERQNPEIASKYTQLSRAKDRLAKMEEVIAMIGTARRNGQNLREVIPPDYLAILEEAEEELSDRSPVPRARPHPQEPVEEESEVTRPSRRPTRPPRMGSSSRGEAGLGLGRDSQGRNSQVREQESREISAMQQRLNKTTARVSAVNEGSRPGHEKGAVKKQPQALWQGRSESGSGVDPRVSEVLAMQEELRQKKNALEALMRRMGKSSSLNMDNISDNISDNVSDTSDRLMQGRSGGGTATWGEGGLHHFSDNHYHQSSDEELIEEDDVDVPLQGQHRPQQPPPLPVSPKDRNRHSTSRHRRRQDSGRFSVNNLSTSHTPLTRTKHNRLRAGSAPKALWEPVEGSNYKSPSNTTMQTQHSLNTALSQLTQVQGTINNLQESLRQEQSQVLGGTTGATHYPPQLGPSLLPDLTPTSLGSVPDGQAVTPMSAYTGLGSLSLTARGGDLATQQLMVGLEQCFTRLHIHSLEIQALSKHLQLLERRDQTGSAPIPDVGGGICGGRGGRGGARRSEEEEEDEEDNEEEEDVPGGTRPPYPLHHNLLATSGMHSRKDGLASRVSQSSFPLFLRQQSDVAEGQSTGVTNPIYGHLSDLRDQAAGTWGSLAPTPSAEQPSDGLASLMGPAVVDSSASHPLLHLGRMDERSQSQAPEPHHWASLASTHPLHHQTTDLLNNQVPPGTRANNYWDNFRSYSRQNLLSTATKSNTSDPHPASSASAPAPTPTTTTLQQGREGGRGEDKRFNVSLGHNNNNSGVGGAGARTRMPNPHINNPRGAANPRVRNPVAASPQHLLGQNKHKANNRNKQTGGLWPASKVEERNLPPQERGSAGRNLGYLNYNYAHANASDSDGGGRDNGGGGGGAGVTVEVLREADALIRRHAGQPEFLLQLFRHAAQITVHTDQHVAVALLHDLASQPHRPSNHGVNANARGSSLTRTENTASLSLPAPLRDSWRPQPPRTHPQNILPQENVSVVGLSGSEVSDSGLTSEDEDSRALYRNVKNLSLSPGGGGLPSALPQPGPGGVNTSIQPQYPQPPHLHHHPHYQNYQDFPQHHNLSNPPTTQGGESTRSVANSESSLYDHLVFNDSHLASRQEVVEDWVRQGAQGEEARSKLLNQPDTAGSSPEDAHSLIHPLNNDTEYLTFETLVASAVREGTEVLQAQAQAHTREGVASLLLLNSLHQSLVAHIQTRAQSLRLPQSFLLSTDAELKTALHALSGKPLAQVSNDVASVISHVLLTQYCTVLVQRLRDNQPVLPQTPTKLPPATHAKTSEVGTEGGASVASAFESSHPQEATTATQTEAGVFSLHPQRPSQVHGGHTFSLTSNSHTQPLHPAPPAPTPQAATPGGGHWQAPPPAPLPSPNHNPSGGEPLSESSACGTGLPSASQPEAWALVGGMETPAPPPTPHGGSQGGGRVEPEHEEAMMDDLVEPVLAVHTLAEADQSQDADDGAEGDWGEDSQAEGIMQAEIVGAAAVTPSPATPSQHPGWLQARDNPPQDLDEVPTKLQSPQGGSPGGTPDHHHHHHHHHQRPHSPAGSEG